MKKLLLLAIVVLGISAVSFGQDGNTLTASATASAKILKVLKITATNSSLSFGAMTVPQDEVTVRLTTANAISEFSATGKISLLPIAPTSVSQYTVTGDNGAKIHIGLPTSFTMGTSPSLLTVKEFKSSVGTDPTLDTNNGTLSFSVGADLVLDENATPGTYTKSFDITVAYE